MDKIAELVAAAKDARKIAWPWMDKHTGNPRLTYDEWAAICDRLDRAIQNVEGKPNEAGGVSVWSA